MRTIERTIAVALIFSADGKIFQGQKDPNKGGVYSDGYWHIPGGGVEKGERIEQALIREVREETGLDVSSLAFQLIDDTGTGESEKTLPTGEKVKVNMKFFTYKIVLPFNSKDVPIQLNDDLATHRWTDLADLKNLKLTPPSIKLFMKLGYL